MGVYTYIKLLPLGFASRIALVPLTLGIAALEGSVDPKVFGLAAFEGTVDSKVLRLAALEGSVDSKTLELAVLEGSIDSKVAVVLDDMTSCSSVL